MSAKKNACKHKWIDLGRGHCFLLQCRKCGQMLGAA